MSLPLLGMVQASEAYKSAPAANSEPLKGDFAVSTNLTNGILGSVR